jgi:hypothetical protein
VTTLPTTSSTVPAIPSTTTTTLPDPCASIGPTFVSIECRLRDLADALNALGAAPRAAPLRNQLAKARGDERNGYAVCAGTDAKGGKRALKGSVQALGRLRALLASNRAKTVPGRTELLATVDQLRRDMRTLRSALSCPADAVAS